MLVGIVVFVGHTVWSIKREVDRDAREQARDQREIGSAVAITKATL